LKYGGRQTSWRDLLDRNHGPVCRSVTVCWSVPRRQSTHIGARIFRCSAMTSAF